MSFLKPVLVYTHLYLLLLLNVLVMVLKSSLLPPNPPGMAAALFTRIQGHAPSPQQKGRTNNTHF